MRRFFSVIVLCLFLNSCEDQVKFNNPAVQGLKNNVLWSATLIDAVQEADGSLTIEAYAKNDVLTLKTESVDVNTYIIGVDDVNTIKLVETTANSTTVFSTGENSGNGQIVITEFDAVNHTISGEFKCNIPNESGSSAAPYVNFIKGVFYKIPLKTK
ncbi:DUF6252 family protein [Flavobacterium sp.]|uniref:DUF6252 family protein n=1 Tax=Flavobacterium sp. TaxID=239 RepID=UPI002BD68E37|nr:DUF6252 family protein [Flavobacterium sp.]HSD08224.1 DUF6252 family protein [Flavobacterium sp.]